MRRVELCPKCKESSVKRIQAAIDANPDRDVDWWAQFFEKEQQRQLKHLQNHCDNWSIGNNAEVK